MPELEPKVSPNLSRWPAGMRPTPTKPLLVKVTPSTVTVFAAIAR